MVATTEIEVRHLPAQSIAYQRFHGTIASIESVTSAVRSWVVTMGYEPRGPLTIELHDDPGEDSAAEYDIEAQLPVEDGATAAPDDHVQVKRFEPTDAVVMTLHGPCDLASMREPLERMRDWARQRNARSTTVVRWVEVTDPAKVTPEEQVTELQLLVAPGTLSTGASAPPLVAGDSPTYPTVGASATAHLSPSGAGDGETRAERPAQAGSRIESMSPGTPVVAPPPASVPPDAAGAAPVPPETRQMAGSGAVSGATAPAASEWADRRDVFSDEQSRGGVSPLVLGGAAVLVLVLAVIGVLLYRRAR